MEKVIFHEYEKSWSDRFKSEELIIKSSLEFTKIFIDHVGSTSVDNMPSKPIIDILIFVCNWSEIQKIIKKLESIGYSKIELCDDTPRAFLKKQDTSYLSYYHLHLCPPRNKWGVDMIIFRNALRTEQNLAKDYAELKKSLSKKHMNDIQSYALGKKSFIDGKLLEIKDFFSTNRLLSQQRAELNKAENLQICMIVAQLCVATITSASVYLSDNKYLFACAIFSFIIMLIWLFLSKSHLAHRSAGDQARRVILLKSGLDLSPSAEQQLRIIDGFKADHPSKDTRREEDHFATREKPGNKRLVEMIEESSYWTHHLQTNSARIMFLAFIAFSLILCLTIGAAISSFDSNNLISISRAILAVMIFFISSDVLGLLVSYVNSTKTINEVFNRVESIASRGYQDADVILLMSDYNAAIEKAPSTLPFVFKISQKSLTRRWHNYLEAKTS